jgi:TolA-binding protein
MSPKAIQFKANSIIYFQGDLNEKVYILKAGRVSLKSNDIETGQEIQDMIQTGEFFGVKSALGKYPREETAIVLKPSAVIEFTVPEFEQLAAQNTRIIMKMLKVFSNQLRRIHNQVQNLITANQEGMNPEEGLYKIGKYYLSVQKHSQAMYAFRQYITYYPSGDYADEASRNLAECEQKVQTGAPASGATDFAGSEGSAAGDSSGGGGAATGKQLSDVAQKYYNAVSLFSQQKYGEALKEFQKIISEGQDPEYEAKSIFEVGRCLFNLGKYDQCIKHYTGMIQKYPKHPELLEALFYVGSCYASKEMPDKAKTFYNKIVTMATDDDAVLRKAKKAIKRLEGK